MRWVALYYRHALGSYDIHNTGRREKMKMMGMIALCAMVLVACGEPSTIEDIRDKAREQGYTQGYGAGHYDGRTEALNEPAGDVYNLGYWDGYDDGFTDAQ